MSESGFWLPCDTGTGKNVVYHFHGTVQKIITSYLRLVLYIVKNQFCDSRVIQLSFSPIVVLRSAPGGQVQVPTPHYRGFLEVSQDVNLEVRRSDLVVRRTWGARWSWLREGRGFWWTTKVCLLIMAMGLDKKNQKPHFQKDIMTFTKRYNDFWLFELKSICDLTSI